MHVANVSLALFVIYAWPMTTITFRSSRYQHIDTNYYDRGNKYTILQPHRPKNRTGHNMWFVSIYSPFRLFLLFKFLPRCIECRRGLAIRILSVRLSVCPSVRRVICDKMEETSVQIFIPYIRSFSLVFWEEEWLVGGDPLYLKFSVNRPPLEQIRWFSTNNRS